MPVLGTVINLLQGMENLDKTQAETQLDQVRAKIGQQQLDSTEKRDQALLQISQAEAARQQQVAPKAPSDDQSIVGSIDQQIKEAQSQFDDNNALAQKYKASGVASLVAEGLAMDQKNNLIRSNIRQLRTEQMKAKNDEIKQMGGIASSVNDQPTFEAALPMLREIDPKFGRTGQFDRDITGNPVWGPKTATSMKVMSDQTITAQNKFQDQMKVTEAETKAALAQMSVQVSEARIALMNAQVAKAQAQTDKIRTPPDAKEKSAAKLRATRGPNKNDVDAAKYDILVTEGWEDTNKWDLNSITALGHDVAALTNNIVAASLDKGERISADDARQEAIEKLKPYVDEAKKPSSGLGSFVPDKLKDLAGIKADTQLKYRRPGGATDAGRINTGTGEDKKSGTRGAPTADDVAAKYGG